MAPSKLWCSQDNMGLDGERASTKLLAQALQVGEVLGMHREIIYRNIVGGVSGMRPAEDGIARGMQDLLRVGTGEVRGEGDVESEVDGAVGDG